MSIPTTEKATDRHRVGRNKKSRQPGKAYRLKKGHATRVNHAKWDNYVTLALIVSQVRQQAQYPREGGASADILEKGHADTPTEPR